MGSLAEVETRQKRILQRIRDLERSLLPQILSSLTISSHQSPHGDSNLNNNDTQSRLSAILKASGVRDFLFKRIPSDYYEKPLQYRKESLQAFSIDHLCKSIVMVNTQAHASVTDCSDRNNSKYHIVVVQYTARLNAENVKNFLYSLRGKYRRKDSTMADRRKGKRIVENEPSKQKRCRAPYETWSGDEDKIMLSILAEEVQKGNKTGNGNWRPNIWPKVLEQFKDATGREKTRDNVLGRQKTWKKMYQKMRSLVSSSGWGWDKVAEKLAVEELEWRNFIKDNPDAKSIRKAGFHNYDLLDVVVGKYMATGSNVVHTGERVPGVQIEANVELDNGPEIPVEDNMTADNTIEFAPDHSSSTFREESSSVRQATSSARRCRHRAGMTERDMAIVDALDNLSTSIRELAASDNRPKYPWEEALAEIQDLDVDLDFATSSLLDTEERKSQFVKYPPKRRKAFLRYLKSLRGYN